MRTLLLILATGSLTCSGCAAVGEAVLDAVFHSAVDSAFHSSHEIDPHILERKGIEPGGKRHKRLVAEEEFYRDSQRRFNSDD